MNVRAFMLAAHTWTGRHVNTAGARGPAHRRRPGTQRFSRSPELTPPFEPRGRSGRPRRVDSGFADGGDLRKAGLSMKVWAAVARGSRSSTSTRSRSPHDVCRAPRTGGRGIEHPGPARFAEGFLMSWIERWTCGPPPRDGTRRPSAPRPRRNAAISGSGGRHHQMHVEALLAVLAHRLHHHRARFVRLGTK